MKKWILALIVLLLFSTTVYADEAIENGNPYSDTVNAVFDRLNGKVFEKTKGPTPGGYQAPSGETPTGNQSGDQSSNQQQGQSNNSNIDYESPIKDYVVPGIPDTYKGSILERMQSDHTVSAGNVREKADSIGTAIHYTVSEWVIGLAPILLIIAVGLMLFSSARAAGFLIMCGIAIFVILFAPELVQIFINSIMGVFY